MANYLRSVGSIARWKLNEEQKKANDFSSGAYVDMRTESEKLSIYQYNNEEDIKIIVASLTAGRDKVDIFDYITFSDNEISASNIQITKTLGETCCQKANELHHDMINISGKKLYEIIKKITINNTSERIAKNKMKEIIREVLKTHQIDEDKIKNEWVLKEKNGEN